MSFVGEKHVLSTNSRHLAGNNLHPPGRANNLERTEKAEGDGGRL